MRQWVLSFPFQLRFLFASRPEIMGWVLGIVYRVIATHLVKKAGHTQSGQDGRGHPDPAFWIGAQSECSLPHAVSRRCVCRAIPRLSAFPLGQGADQPRAHPADAHHRPPGGSLSGTARPAGTGCRNSYLASDAVDDDPMTPAGALDHLPYRCRFTGGAKGVHFANSADQW